MLKSLLRLGWSNGSVVFLIARVWHAGLHGRGLCTGEAFFASWPFDLYFMCKSFVRSLS